MVNVGGSLYDLLLTYLSSQLVITMSYLHKRALCTYIFQTPGARVVHVMAPSPTQ